MEQGLKTIFSILREENKLLKEQAKLLKGRTKLLEEQTKLLEERLTYLEEANKELLQENHQLKEQLGLNSTNSSLPPSRDLYPNKNRHRPTSGLQPGGQPGHAPHHYKPMVADQVIELFPERCSCGQEVKTAQGFTKEQKIDFPPIKPYVKEYIRWHGRCPKCRKKVIAPLPAGVGKDLLGHHAKAIISSLNGCFHNSKREVQEILKEIFHLPLSLGLISNTNKRVKEKLGKEYEKIEEAIKTSPYLHMDETGHKSKGKRGWAWVFTNQEHTLLKISPSRGKQVLKDS
jgi:transposase